MPTHSEPSKVEFTVIPKDQGFAYVSPIDGVAVHLDGWSQSAVMFAELEKAGKLIRDLRQEVDALKAALPLIGADI